MTTIQSTQPTTARNLRPAETDPLVPFDRDQLVERCMGSLELADRLLSRFEQRFPLEISEIETFLQQRDDVNLAHIAHRLKGAAANISAPALRGALQHVEDAARTTQLDLIEACLAEVAQEYQRFVSHKTTDAGASAPACRPTQSHS